MQLRLQTAAHAMLECLKASAWYATIYVRTHTHILTLKHIHIHMPSWSSTQAKINIRCIAEAAASTRLDSSKRKSRRLGQNCGRRQGEEQVVFARSFGFDKQLWPQLVQE